MPRTLARRMVTHWGMSERLGPVTFRDSEEHPFLGREIAEPRRFSEHTAQLIDEEVSRILRAASDRAVEMLTQHREQLECLAKALEAEETLDDAAIEKLLGPPAWKTAEAAGNNGKKNITAEHDEYGPYCGAASVASKVIVEVLPPHPDLHPVTGIVLLQGVVEIVADADVMLAELHNHVASPQTAAVGRTAGNYRADRIARLLASEIGHAAQERPRRVAGPALHGHGHKVRPLRGVGQGHRHVEHVGRNPPHSGDVNQGERVGGTVIVGMLSREEVDVGHRAWHRTRLGRCGPKPPRPS